MPTPTVAMVTGLWDHMTVHFGSRLASKADAPEMQLVAFALDEMGIMDPDRFLDRYTTTIGKIIYAPFIVGVGDEDDLGRQLRVCGHEHQHVAQYVNHGATFAWDYLVDSARRAAFEAEAFQTTMELHYWLDGTVGDPRALADGLVHYGCTPEDIEVCAKANEMAARVISQGGVISEAGQVAVEWLNAHTEPL